MQFAGKFLKTKFSEFFSLRRFFMKKNVLKCILGIMFCSVLVFGCKEPPAPSSPDSFDSVSNKEESNKEESNNSFDTVLKGVTSTPATEKEFNEMMDEIIKEMKDAFDLMNGANARLVSPSGDAISSKADITKKLNSIVENINKAASSLTGEEIKFSFDESINIKDATFTDLIEAISEIDALKGMNVELTNEQKKVFNEYLTINNLYAKAKADVNFDSMKLNTEGKDSSDSVGSANVELLCAAALTDFEALIQNINKSAEKPTLPVKAASYVVSLDANASAQYKDVYEIIHNGSLDSNVKLEGASFGVNLEGKTSLAVCTKSGKGGKLEISPKVSIDKQFIVDYIKLQNEYSKKINELWNENLGYETIQTKLQELSEEFQKNQNELLNDVIKINISIGDFSKEYNYSELYSELMKLFA